MLERLRRKLRPQGFLFIKKEVPAAHMTVEVGRYQGWPQAGPPTLPSRIRKVMWLWATERKCSWVGAGGVIPGRKLAPQESGRGTHERPLSQEPSCAQEGAGRAGQPSGSRL